MSNEVLHDHALVILRAREVLSTVVEVLKKCHGPIKAFQPGKEDASFPLLKKTGMSVINFSSSIDEASHVLLFDQSCDDQKHTHAFLCKCVNGNLLMVQDLYYASLDEKWTPVIRYEHSLIYMASCVMRNCFRGSTFPYKVALWLATNLASIECITLGTLPLHSTWLLSEDESHWTTLVINDTVFKHKIHFDNLLMCISINRSSVASHVSVAQKRPRDRLCIINQDNFKECFTFLDCTTSSQGNHSVFELNWCYDEFSSLLHDVTTTTMCDNIMQSFKSTSPHQVMKGMSHEFKFINQPPKHEIMSKSCLCCKATIKDAVQKYGEVMMPPTYHVFASVTSEKRFDFNSCDDKCISMVNLTMTDTDSQLFFYSVAKEPDAQCGGKDMNTLRTSALHELTSMMDSFKEKWDAHRPSSETVCADKIRMCPSRIDKPLRKSNNDKGELKLHNHTRALTQVGDSWKAITCLNNFS